MCAVCTRESSFIYIVLFFWARAYYLTGSSKLLHKYQKPVLFTPFNTGNTP